MACDQEVVLCAWLDDRFCRSTVEIRARISTEFGLCQSHSGGLKRLARLGYEHRTQGPATGFIDPQAGRPHCNA